MEERGDMADHFLKILLILFIALGINLSNAEGLDDFFARESMSGPGSYPGIPQRAVEHAFQFLRKHYNRVYNRDYMVIVDFTKPMDQRRFHLLDLRSGTHESYMVAHGSGSGSGRWVEDVSDIPDSHMSSEGIFLTAETYYSDNPGIRLKLDGVSRTNQNTRERLIVVHGARYVSESAGATGHSQGCFALDFDVSDYVINRIKGGAVMLAYFNR